MFIFLTLTCEFQSSSFFRICLLITVIPCDTRTSHKCPFSEQYLVDVVGGVDTVSDGILATKPDIQRSFRLKSTTGYDTPFLPPCKKSKDMTKHQGHRAPEDGARNAVFCVLVKPDGFTGLDRLGFFLLITPWKINMEPQNGGHGG